MDLNQQCTIMDRELLRDEKNWGDLMPLTPALGRLREDCQEQPGVHYVSLSQNKQNKKPPLRRTW